MYSRSTYNTWNSNNSCGIYAYSCSIHCGYYSNAAIIWGAAFNQVPYITCDLYIALLIHFLSRDFFVENKQNTLGFYGLLIKSTGLWGEDFEQNGYAFDSTKDKWVWSRWFGKHNNWSNKQQLVKPTTGIPTNLLHFSLVWSATWRHTLWTRTLPPTNTKQYTKFDNGTIITMVSVLNGRSKLLWFTLPSPLQVLYLSKIQLIENTNHQ